MGAVCMRRKMEMVMDSLLTVNAERGAFLSPLSLTAKFFQILSCQVKLTTSRQDEEGGPAKLSFLPPPPSPSLYRIHAFR